MQVKHDEKQSGKNALYRLKVMLHETIRKNDF